MSYIYRNIRTQKLNIYNIIIFLRQRLPFLIAIPSQMNAHCECTYLHKTNNSNNFNTLDKDTTFCWLEVPFVGPKNVNECISSEIKSKCHELFDYILDVWNIKHYKMYDFHAHCCDHTFYPIF